MGGGANKGLCNGGHPPMTGGHAEWGLMKVWGALAGKKVTCANNASYPIKGVGKILITISDGSDLCLPDVLYVPGIKKNLLSVSSLAKNGLRVIFEDDRCIVRDRENGYSLITTGMLENGLFVLDRYEKQIQACIAETKTQAMQDAELWHARFGHVGYGSLMTLQRHNMVHDLSLLEMPPRHVCECCVLRKMHRFAFSQDGSVRATRKLQLVHSDVCGPMRMPSVGNSFYFVTFIDDFSRFCWVYPLKAKSDVFAIFQHYVSMVENETSCKVQTLRTDRGGEYMSGAFKDFLGKKGIKHQCTMPYTLQQNGVAKRKNRSLMEMARCMLKAKSLPHNLWMEAVACAAHVLTRCPTRALKTITPYESWYDKKSSVSYLCVFGCLSYAHIPQQLRGKLDDKAVKCIFVGYNSGRKGYRLYNPATNKIFAETTAQPMVAFDVPHMQTQDIFEGFLPSFVENQGSQQVDNFDQSFDQHVTPHDVEEIVREEQEVLREERTLPKWVQKTLQDSKLDAPLPRKTRADGFMSVLQNCYVLLPALFLFSDEHMRKLVPHEVIGDDHLIEYDALLLEGFMDILQDLHGDDMREKVQLCYELASERENAQSTDIKEKLQELEEVQIAFWQRVKLKKSEFEDENGAITEFDLEETFKSELQARVNEIVAAEKKGAKY
ncbi:hypothetical protein L7F22_000258 [Adiantum nelumboides]|nr:hypothetical protein [Adiantum nelumboides]